MLLSISKRIKSKSISLLIFIFFIIFFIIIVSVHLILVTRIPILSSPIETKDKLIIHEVKNDIVHTSTAPVNININIQKINDNGNFKNQVASINKVLLDKNLDIKSAGEAKELILTGKKLYNTEPSKIKQEAHISTNLTPSDPFFDFTNFSSRNTSKDLCNRRSFTPTILSNPTTNGQKLTSEIFLNSRLTFSANLDPWNIKLKYNNSVNYVDKKIDLVYTWVNGSDPNWIKQAKQYYNKDFHENKYREWDELKYSMRSIFKYAPWIRYIHVVVHDGQKPLWLNNNPRIRIVPHSSIFKNPQEELPSFNSLAIESYIHNIPDLSETYLYMNNDLFFVRPVGIASFVDGPFYIRYNDYSVLYPDDYCSNFIFNRDWNEFKNLGSDCFCFGDTNFMNSVVASAFFKYIPQQWFMHIPHLFHKPVVFDVEKRIAEVLNVTRRNRIRKPTDINIFVQFEAYLASMEKPWKKIMNINYDDLKRRFKDLAEEVYVYKVFQNHDTTLEYYDELNTFLSIKKPLFFGIDDDLDNPAKSTIDFHRLHLTKLFEKHFPDPAPWER